MSSMASILLLASHSEIRLGLGQGATKVQRQSRGPRTSNFVRTVGYDGYSAGRINIVTPLAGGCTKFRRHNRKSSESSPSPASGSRVHSSALILDTRIHHRYSLIFRRLLLPSNFMCTLFPAPIYSFRSSNGERRYVFVLMSPAIRSKLFPSGCRSMYSTPCPPPPPHPSRSGSVRSRPCSGVMPTMRTFRGGVTVVSVTSWSLHPYPRVSKLKAVRTEDARVQPAVEVEVHEGRE